MAVITNIKKHGAKIYFGGVPTEPDVKKLMAAYPPSEMEIADEIPYEDVERIISATRRTHRFTSITWAWRKQLEKNYGIMVGVNPGHAYKVLSESEKLLYTQKKHRGVGKAVRRIITVSQTLIDRNGLTEEEKKAKDTMDLAVGQVAAISQIKSRLVLPEI